MSASEFRRCLEELDLEGVRRLWARDFPQLPQPRTDQETLERVHFARTAANSIRFKLRAYSHRWLLERGLPSGLPDRLKPAAERIYPVVVEAVGIAVAATSPLLKPIVPLVRAAMSDAVADMYADNAKPDPMLVKRHMLEVRQKTLQQLLGRVNGHKHG